MITCRRCNSIITEFRVTLLGEDGFQVVCQCPECDTIYFHDVYHADWQEEDPE